MLDTLPRIIDALSHTTSLDKGLGLVVHTVKQQLAVDVCSVYLAEGTDANCILMATDGVDPTTVGRVRLGQRQGLVGLVLESRHPVSITNVQQQQRSRSVAELGEDAYRAFLGVPIIQGAQALGVLAVRQMNERTFGNAEESFLVTVAAELARFFHAVAMGAAETAARGRKQTARVLAGIKAAPGVGIGTAVLPSPLAAIDSVPDKRIDDTEAEEAAFRKAVEEVRAELRASGERIAARVPAEAHAMFRVYAAMLEDEHLFTNTLERIRAGSWAPGALRATIAQHSQAFEEINDPYLRARAEDIRGLGRRVLLRLQSANAVRRRYPKRCVLVGEEISVARIADVPIEKLAGIICKRGSPFSHAAILARTLRIPAVMNVGDLPLDELDGRRILVEGYEGRIFIEPSSAITEAFRRRLEHETRIDIGLAGLRDLPAETPDGMRVPLYANAGLLSDVLPALDRGAEGIGLYRTEFTFMVRESFPEEQAQYEVYREVLGLMAPRPVVMRTLDAGGDKGLSYFPIQEDNGLLGWRGIRLTLDNPGIFLTQLRAMLRANAQHHNLQLLLPMISSPHEVDDVLDLLARAREDLQHAGLAQASPKLGVMIEVPSTIYQIEALSKRVDFFSIGTNDLTQYLLAVDRGNARVAGRYNNLDPAVIRAIDYVVRQAHAFGKPISVCGDMAGDPMSAILLIGMGIDALSMASASLPQVKQAIRTFTRQRAREILGAALAAEKPAEVRELLKAAVAPAGLRRSLGMEALEA